MVAVTRGIQANPVTVIFRYSGASGFRYTKKFARLPEERGVA